jgi:DNA-binding transcriptional regulator YiaG
VQKAYGLHITAGQDWCAEQLHTSRRSFQQWESGDRSMHPAFWELLKIKTALIAHKF